MAEGLGDAIGLDPSLVRIAFALLALASGAGLILYIGAWMLMLPPNGRPGAAATESIGERPTPALIFGGVLLGIGLLVGLMTLDGFDPLPATIIGLIFVGIVLLNRPSETALTSPAPTPWPPPVAGPVPESVADPTEPFEVPTDTDESVGPTLPFGDAVTENFIEQDIRQLESELAAADFGPLGAQESNLSDDLNRAHWALARTEGETTLATEDNRYNPGPPLASITLAAFALLTGIGLVFNTLIGETVKVATLAGIGTAAVGIAIAISAFTGRTIRLIPIAVVSLLVLLASPFIDFAAADGIGSSEIRVSSLETLQDEYGVGIGYLELRLDDLVITEDTEIDATVGVGSLEITVPANTNVELRGRTEIGYIFLLDGERAGIDQSYTRIPGGRADTNSPTLTINAETTIGEVSIYRARG